MRPVDRKFTRRLLGAGIFLLASAAVPVYAATLTSESAAVTQGQTLDIAVALDSAPGQQVASLQFDVVFDPVAMAITGALLGNAAEAANKDVLYAPQGNGHIRVIIFGLLNQTVIADGSVAELQVSVNADAPSGSHALTLTGVVLSNPQGGQVPATAIPGSLTLGQASPHAADSNQDWIISLSEILRVIQFFSLGSLHCDAASEDGYAPGGGSQACGNHNSDYAPADWKIDISELLRLIQLFNAPGYSAQIGTEDGFAPNTTTESTTSS